MTDQVRTPVKQLPPGRYLAKAVEYFYGKTKNTGTPGLEVMFQIQAGDYDAAFTGKTISRMFFFTEKALAYTVKDLRTCGFVGDDLRKVDGITSKLVQLQIELEDGYPRIKYINQVGWGLKKENPMSAKDFADLGNLATLVRKADIENAARDAERKANRGFGVSGGTPSQGFPQASAPAYSPPPTGEYTADADF